MAEMSANDEPATEGPSSISTDEGDGKRGNRTAKLLRSGIDSCRRLRRELVDRWQDNVAFRTGRPFNETPDTDTVNIPADWSRTKNKQAQLFAVLPDLKLRSRNPKFQPLSPLASAALNFEMRERIHAEYPMDECGGDVINAAGLMAARVIYTAVFGDPQKVPVGDVTGIPPEDLEQMIAGDLIPTEEVRPTLYECYDLERVSPARLLWPVEFRGSNWQKSPWLGHDGHIAIEEARRRGWVDDDYEPEEAGETTVDELLSDEDHELKLLPSGRYLRYSELWYRAAFYDATERHPRKLRHMVFIDGIDEPVVDEDFAWQEWVEGSEGEPPSPQAPQGVPPSSGRYIGMTDFPIKVRTLTYISDSAIPPSDSEMGRPQVKEMIRSRSQMIRQREHSLPIRWFDVNMVDEEIAAQLRAGVMQDMIPMNGPGSNAIGEVARANYPRENFEFMRIFNTDLDETWSMGANQMGIEAPGDQSATEAKIVQSSGNVRIEYERSKYLSFYVECAQGVFALMQLFSDYTDYVEVIGDNGVRTLQQWNKDKIPGDWIFEVKPDAAVRVDINQRKQEILNVYKLLRRDPLINPSAVIMELCEVYGLDPARWIAPPKEEKPPAPNIRYSFKGDDTLNPFVIALIQKSPNPVTAQDIAQAKALLTDALSMMPQIAEAVPGAVKDPTAEARQKADAKNQPHPGPAATVQPLNRRYETSEDAAGTVTQAAGPQGSAQ